MAAEEVNPCINRAGDQHYRCSACDGKVDLSDLVTMKTEFLRTNCTPGDPCEADCNGDGKVDLADLVIMKGEFLQTGCQLCA